MAITGRTFGAAANQVRDHLNQLFSHTITQTPLVAIGVSQEGTDRFRLSFRKNGLPSAVQLATNQGPLWLSISQHCESTPSKDRHRLITVEYRYTLAVDEHAEPVIRWEYVRHRPTPTTPEGTVPQWARHHIQGTIEVDLGGGALPLNQLHLPTGYIVIEDVIRFLIWDLGVRPLSMDWAARLDESYLKFRHDFTQD